MQNHRITRYSVTLLIGILCLGQARAEEQMSKDIPICGNRATPHN